MEEIRHNARHPEEVFAEENPYIEASSLGDHFLFYFLIELMLRSTSKMLI